MRRLRCGRGVSHRLGDAVLYRVVVAGHYGCAWPGGAAGLLYYGQVGAAFGTLLLFLAIPVGIAVSQNIAIPWDLLGPVVLIALGMTWLVRAFVTREPIEQ